jgi:hypothetical protein
MQTEDFAGPKPKKKRKFKKKQACGRINKWLALERAGLRALSLFGLARLASFLLG